MKKRLLVQYTATSEGCRWLYCNDSGKTMPPARDGLLDDLAAELGQDSADVVLLVPSTDVVLKRLAFTANERRHVLKTARFDLEEQLINDIDELHFAYAKPSESELDVAVVQREKLQGWLQPLQQLQLNVVAVLSTQWALPQTENEWVVIPEGHGISVKTAALQGFIAPLDAAPLAWDLCTREHETLPDVITVYAEPARLQEQILSTMPAALAERVKTEQGP